MVGAVDGEDSVDPHRGLSLHRNSSIDPVRTEYDFRVAVTLQHFAMHLTVTHAAAAVAAPGVHNDCTGELARRGIEPQRAFLQAECPAHRMKHITEQEIDSGVLRVQPEYQFLG